MIEESYYSKNIESRREYQREYRKKNPDYVANWKKTQGKELVLDWNLKSLYGITLEEYKNLCSLQEGVCAVCGNLPDEGKRLTVDHDHQTDEIRGLLCSTCNTMFGHAKDDPEILEKGAKYLRGKKNGSK